MSRVRHKVTRQSGWALEYNFNKNDPAFWCEWDDGYANWFGVADLETGPWA